MVTLGRRAAIPETMLATVAPVTDRSSPQNIGSLASTLRAIPAVPSIPLRKLTGSCITTTSALGGTWITGHLQPPEAS